MKRICLLAAVMTAYLSAAATAEPRDISEPLRLLGANVEALGLTRLNKTEANDPRLAYELVLAIQIDISSSMDGLKSLPDDIQQAILAICSELLFPLMDTTNATTGFLKVEGARIMLKGKPTFGLGSVGMGRYATLIFPSARGCTFGW